jgi:kinesin family member C2/C3
MLSLTGFCYSCAEKVFEKTAPFVTSVLDGFNVCIFTYGQTGTGKTFTMEGIEGALGVNYRTLEEFLRIIKEREGLFQYEITVSVLEVYNEQIHDLLMTDSQQGGATKRYADATNLILSTIPNV